MHTYICTYLHMYIHIYTNTGQEQLRGPDFARWWQCSCETKCTSSGHWKIRWLWKRVLRGKMWSNDGEPVDLDGFRARAIFWQSHVDSHMHMGLCEYKVFAGMINSSQPWLRVQQLCPCLTYASIKLFWLSLSTAHLHTFTASLFSHIIATLIWWSRSMYDNPYNAPIVKP